MIAVIWGPSHTPLHWVCFAGCMFNSNNFVGSAALVAQCIVIGPVCGFVAVFVCVCVCV